SSGLDAPCPLAGLLDPHRCPDVLSLALARSGGEPRWKPYVAISCQDALWGLFWDAGRLRDMQQHEAISELFRAGVVPRGIQSGFTASQAGRTLEEINHVLPTRAVLRIGIVSSGQGSTSCTDGLVTWSRQPYNKESEGFTGPRSIEVYDSRKPDSQPSSEEISSLADDTGHHVRWFFPSAATPSKDLIIIDHLGLASPVSEVYPWRSPATEGSLVRSRIRLDRNDAELVIESRVGNIVRSEDSLLDELSQTIGQVESIAENRGACSHIAFMPNREVLSGELQDTRFLAVSSTEIDPACFARSTPQAGGFLWDYELPHAVGPGEQRGGFYLLARPPDAIKRAVLGATKLVSQSDIDLDALLIETSRRGIPILKRLAAGGSLARGELGMLLAVRLLQDAFRGPGRRVRLPVCGGTTIRMVLPVDPYVSPLEKLRQGLHKANPTLREATRPDLLLACIQVNQVDRNEGTQVHLVPLEVKFREGIMAAQDKATSLAQASNLGDMLHYLLRATPMSELWKICGLGFLSEILDHGFRVYGDPSVNGKSPEQWVEIHQACLADVVSGRVKISIAQEGRLLVFDESPHSYVDDTDRDGFEETLVVSREDSRVLLEDGVQISQSVDQVASLLDICGPDIMVSSTTESVISVGQQVGTLRDSEPVSPQVPVDSASAPTLQEPSTVVPPRTREHVAGAFSGFIGNRPAVDTLRRAILKALLSDPPQLPASYLFTGNPSTGKTELARRVARSLALPFVSLDGRGLVSRERLFDLIDGKLRDNGQQATRVGTQFQKPELEYPPLVVFIDEVHLVPRLVQESLLTALEPKDRSVLLVDRVARLPQITFLFATTRPSDVDMAFRTRCTEIPLQDYTEEEVAAIVELDYPDWVEPLRRRIARYGRLVPRIALEFARELANEALVSEHQDRDLDQHLDEVRRTRLIDENGLGSADIEYLELLERETRPLGERNILTMLANIDKDRFLEEVEPLLVVRMKLVRRTGRGREITSEGRRYLIDMRKYKSSAD
ncbi:AAA family ATPase, partial [Candidatus Poribacteria bacterium]|nr:AAA family ATPase [Candidatus Poribacteria bacterium]